MPKRYPDEFRRKVLDRVAAASLDPAVAAVARASQSSWSQEVGVYRNRAGTSRRPPRFRKSG